MREQAGHCTPHPSSTLTHHWRPVLIHGKAAKKQEHNTRRQSSLKPQAQRAVPAVGGVRPFTHLVGGGGWLEELSSWVTNGVVMGLDGLGCSRLWVGRAGCACLVAAMHDGLWEEDGALNGCGDGVVAVAGLPPSPLGPLNGHPHSELGFGPAAAFARSGARIQQLVNAMLSWVMQRAR